MIKKQHQILSITVSTQWDASRENLSATVITGQTMTAHKAGGLPMISSQQHELTVSQWQLCLPFDTAKHMPGRK